LQAIDTVFSDVQDMEGLVASTQEAKALGFDGKGVIHPAQIKPIHKTFCPTSEQIEKAQQIIQALHEAEARGSGVVSLGTKMIDAPVVARAQKILARAKAYGLIRDGQ
ncbi:HpcH/HpaI aldolase/citrate lyase family protein, partial [candidate division KSB1 bacterium]|nr:HpcH/HpaI aldolase/citrate lyase family protein [candidate division KSB1 bacterium]